MPLTRQNEESYEVSITPRQSGKSHMVEAHEMMIRDFIDFVDVSGPADLSQIGAEESAAACETTEQNRVARCAYEQGFRHGRIAEAAAREKAEYGRATVTETILTKKLEAAYERGVAAAERDLNETDAYHQGYKDAEYDLAGEIESLEAEIKAARDEWYDMGYEDGFDKAHWGEGAP